MEDKIRKDLNWAKALSLIEGVCFFVAGLCALMAGSLLGYISGGMMIILGCASIFPVFVGGNEYFLNLGVSIAEDKTADEMFEKFEEEHK